MSPPAARPRHLIFIMGDQLSLTAAALRDADPETDVVVMAEVDAEIRRHPNHKQRVVLFLSAMRHFRMALEERGFEVRYSRVEDPESPTSLVAAFEECIAEFRPTRAVVTEPGRFALVAELRAVANAQGVDLEVREDDHFLCSHQQFESWAAGRKRLTLEYFYREMRKRLDILMDGSQPVGGQWNFDQDNRESFRSDPGLTDADAELGPDDLTADVLAMVDHRYSDLPGSLDRFDWPVTSKDARRLLDHFVADRLADFGTYQDAMWTDRPFLNHSRLAAALNLKLLDPREVVREVVRSYERGNAPLNSVEGFVRQIIGWREFIRGVYWLKMPELMTLNALEHHRSLPEVFWTGRTDMVCMRQTVTQLLETGYAHHIQRLMVSGLFALLYGVEPAEVHDWYMAMFVDSVEWVTLPNVVGMSQFADGGIVGTKPYIASGAYISRQSNYCDSCRFSPKESAAENACPFTVLYWDFLARHEERLASNPRMTMQLRNLGRKTDDQKSVIRRRADQIRGSIASGAL